VILAYEKPGKPSCSNHEHQLISMHWCAGIAVKAAKLMLQHLENVEDRLDIGRDARPPVDLKRLFAGVSQSHTPVSPHPRYRLPASPDTRPMLRDMRERAAQLAQPMRLAAHVRMQRDRAHQRGIRRLFQHLVELIDDEIGEVLRRHGGAPRWRWRSFASCGYGTDNSGPARVASATGRSSWHQSST